MFSATVARLRKCGSIIASSLFDPRPNIAYIGGWLGKANLGDEALFAAYRKLFPAWSLSPYDGGRVQHRLAQRLPIFRAGILSGGTLINCNNDHLTIVERFTNFALPLAVFGTGVETAEFWPGEECLHKWKQLLSAVHFLGVRGPISAQILADAGLPEVEIVGDPVITFAATEPNTAPQPHTLGINIGVTDGRLWGKSETRVKDEMVLVAKLARGAGWTVKWFVVWPKDLAITVEAAGSSRTEEIIQIYDDPLAFIEKCRPLTAFVGMKLHATILSTCALTPSIMLEYRPKCRDYMQSIGFDKFTFRTDTLVAGLIWELIRDISQRRSSIAQELQRRVQALKSRQLSRADQLSRSLLDSSLLDENTLI